MVPKGFTSYQGKHGKSEERFSIFCRCWSEAEERKITFWSLCRKLTAKPWPLICQYQPCHCPTDHRLSLGCHPTCMEGRQTRAVQPHGVEFKNIELNFDSVDSPETLWERLQQGRQWWRTFTERNRLLKRGFWCTSDVKDHSVDGKREPITSVMVCVVPPKKCYGKEMFQQVGDNAGNKGWHDSRVLNCLRTWWKRKKE